MNADRLSGLPFLKDILAVKIDGDLAPDYIAGQEERRAAGRALPVRAEAKLAYLRRLRAAALKPLNRLEVKLRRVDRERGSAFFEVVYDVYAISPAGFTRYTLQLEQKDSAWRSAFLARSGITASPPPLRGEPGKYAQDESELMFLIMAASGLARGGSLPRAHRAFWNAATGFPPGWKAALLGPGPAPFPADRASVELKADMNNDPSRGCTGILTGKPGTL